MNLLVSLICFLPLLVIATPMDDGYDYPKPSCPLVYPSTSTVSVPVLEYVTVKEYETQTIYSVAKPSTSYSTIIKPTTTTEYSRITDYQTRTVDRTIQNTITRTETLPAETRYSTETKYSTLPITIISTTVSTARITTTATNFQIQTSTIRFTETQKIPVTETVSVCTPDNAYLPAASCPPPPPSNAYLPADIQPPRTALSIVPEARQNPLCPPPPTITSTKIQALATTTIKETITRTTIIRGETATKFLTVTKTALPSIRSGGGAESVVAKEAVKKLVTITPTLTSYIYADTITKTVSATHTRRVYV
ncbi:mucin-2-like [Uranotaenia lowii]|uniref:mucin-2-like n=1 Tax=Uranotaenia lowii TaxID=190385 RepID=UPI002478B8BB|nr:mucin-2-like [Uranotaenia lowii]